MPGVETTILKDKANKNQCWLRMEGFLCTSKSELLAGSLEKHLEKLFYLFPFLYIQLPKLL